MDYLWHANWNSIGAFLFALCIPYVVVHRRSSGKERLVLAIGAALCAVGLGMSAFTPTGSGLSPRDAGDIVFVLGIVTINVGGWLRWRSDKHDARRLTGGKSP